MRRLLRVLLAVVVGSGALTYGAIANQAAAATSPPTVSAISVGEYHTCALTTGGGVLCWGLNREGEVGDGTLKSTPTPAWVTGLSSGVTAITTGDQHNCALTQGGGVECWGDNTWDQLGNGTYMGRATTPVAVPELSTGVSAVTAGWEHTCALTTGGAVECWGHNDLGELGNGTTGGWTGTPGPVTGLGSGVVAISAGDDHTCAVTSDGAVWCWGLNSWGALGNGTTTNSSTPVQVSGLRGRAVAISVGYQSSCALTNAGAVECWGGNVGNGSRAISTTAVDVSGLNSDAVAVSAGWGVSCALTSGGAAECWGANNLGQLGDGTTTASATPVGVSGLGSGVAAVSAGQHSCALSTNGTPMCWGDNWQGAVGDGTTTNRSTPVGVHFGQTSTVLEVSDNPSTFSQPVTFTAWVYPTDGGGTVAFSADGSTISGCANQPLTLDWDGYKATCTTSSLLPGQHAIDASYTGDSLYDPSVAQTLQQTVSVCHADAYCVAPGIPFPWQIPTALQLVLNQVNPILHQVGI